MTKILITGAFGQIGSELAPALQNKYGTENVIASGNSAAPSAYQGLSEIADVTNFQVLKQLVEKHHITEIYHLASILSARGEQDPQGTWRINMEGLKNVLELAREFKLKVFWPSSIAAFGPTTPRDNTPQRTVLEPTTMYGVTKLAGELLCQYYFNKYQVDVRSVRFPGIISYKAEPGGGTTDFAVAIFYEAIKSGQYQCFVKEDTVLPMMYMDDAIRAVLELMSADSSKLTIRTSYNLAAISFSAKELADEINKHLQVKVTYVPDSRQAIADSWPKSIDDSCARHDWGWQHQFDLAKMTVVMLENLRRKLG